MVLIDADDAALERASREVQRLLAASEQRGSLSAGLEEAVSRLSVSTLVADLSSARLVIEAVPEIPELKKRVIASVESAVAEEATIATNTSSLSITEISATLSVPERFIGMHFFNPVPASNLVELVRGEATSEVTVDLSLAWVKHIAKEPIVVNDSPGFASSRLGLALGLEAIRMVEAGVASPVDIDLAMTLGYKHPVGPLRLTDLVGLDVRLDIAQYLHTHLGERFEPPALLVEMVARGDLGRKSGRGFFDWAVPEGT